MRWLQATAQYSFLVFQVTPRTSFSLLGTSPSSLDAISKPPQTVPENPIPPQPPPDLPSLAYTFSGAYTLETHLRLRPTRSYIDVLASTTPTTQYRTVLHSYLISLRLRDLPGPPRNPLKGHHLVVPATTRSFPSSVAVPVAPFKLQPAPSMLQHKPSYTKTYPKTYSDPGLTHQLTWYPVLCAQAPGLSSPDSPGLPCLTAGAGYAEPFPESYSISSTSN
ncbi:hypothetical protein GG344DRAFT_82850 [Lentinula edodes]|nr:hypothetical protein GG344DRAFT_82850 [Lentinula edodes]